MSRVLARFWRWRRDVWAVRLEVAITMHDRAGQKATRWEAPDAAG